MGNTSIKYFGFGTNKDLDMMAHMIGRSDIHGESARLFGYELCIIKGNQFRKIIPPGTPLNKSPYDIIVNSWGPDFLMYVSRPNPNGVIRGMIWDITPLELEFVREWELVDYGAQEDAKGIAITDKGELVEVITQSFMKEPMPEIDRVVTDENYEAYIAPKDAMLKRADEDLDRYIKLVKPTKPLASQVP